MTNSVINLNKARKARARKEQRAQADENAIKFGRSKADRVLDAAQNKHARKALDQNKFEDSE